MHKLDDFSKFISDRYGAKGRRSIMFAPRLGELDILLGIKDVSQIDEEDKKYLDDEQLKELERLKEKT